MYVVGKHADKIWPLQLHSHKPQTKPLLITFIGLISTIERRRGFVALCNLNSANIKPLKSKTDTVVSSKEMRDSGLRVCLRLQRMLGSTSRIA